MKKKTKHSLETILPYLIIICAILGLLAAFTLTYDKIHVLKNPNYDPPCNINPILSCGSVMKTEQASLLGVPNTIFGIMGFTALLTFGILLSAGAKVKRWVWLVAEVAAISGFVFMGYLFFQGVFRIGAICPWCFLTWIVTIPVVVGVTAYNFKQKNITLPPSLDRPAAWFQVNWVNIIATLYALIFVILLQHFWYYWSTLL